MKLATKLSLCAFVSVVLLLSTLSTYAGTNSSGTVIGRIRHNDKSSQFKPDEVVVKIGKHHIGAKESLKQAGISVVSNEGTGYCLGQGTCEFILTNYHVAERVGSPLEVNGVHVMQTYEATSPQDKDAVWEKSPQGFSVKLTPVRDIAVFRLKQPLEGMHGIPFSSRELRDGETFRIYGHPGGEKLTMAEATFYREGADGLLFFKATAGEEDVLVPGISGSLVVNENNEAVGLVQGIAEGNFAVVVPVWSLVDFVKQIRPEKFTEIFSFSSDEAVYRPRNSELAPMDLIAESVALAKESGPDAGMSPPPALPEEYVWYNLDKSVPPLAPGIVASTNGHERIAESQNIQALRANAQGMVDSINDMTAVGTQHSIGGKSPEVKLQYQLRMVEGTQTFTIDGKEINQQACPKKNGVGLGAAWAEFPTMVGNNLKLNIAQVDDLNLQGWGKVKVFRYEGTAEDKVAKINYCNNYGLGIHTAKIVAVPVRGEVWTDDSLNILRITRELIAPRSMGWLNFRDSVLYGWLKSPNGERKLVPTNIISRAELKDDHQIYSTLCRITDYHQFSVHAVIGEQNLSPID